MSNLLPLVARGDRQAAAECIGKYGPLVWSLARRFFRDGRDAEDATQDAFLEIWVHAHSFDPDIASEATFIAMIARRRFIDAQRRTRRRPRTEPLLPEQERQAIDHQARRHRAEEHVLEAGLVREAVAAAALADVLVRLGPAAWAEAERTVDRALALAAAIGARSVEAQALLARARLALDRDDVVVARRALERARDLGRAIGLIRYEGIIALLLTQTDTAPAAASA